MLLFSECIKKQLGFSDKILLMGLTLRVRDNFLIYSVKIKLFVKNEIGKILLEIYFLKLIAIKKMSVDYLFGNKKLKIVIYLFVCVLKEIIKNPFNQAISNIFFLMYHLVVLKPITIYMYDS